MFPLRFLPSKTSINFLGKRVVAISFSVIFLCTTFVLLFTKGLNFGIDFTGGILIESRFSNPPSISNLRSALNETNVGDISLQLFGSEQDVLIRIGNQSGGEKERLAAITVIKDALAANFDGDIDYRKVDYVGPKVGSELIKAGLISLALAFVGILLYIWLRFEWQYSLGAIIALFHDVILLFGFYSFTQLEFNLASIAAILTIIGYSINDSVVIFDRIRENLRKYKKMSIIDLLNVSINNNLSRTILTSGTTALALLALIFVAGHTMQSLTIPALFGIIVGTYSSIYIASPVLVYMKLRQEEKP